MEVEEKGVSSLEELEIEFLAPCSSTAWLRRELEIRAKRSDEALATGPRTENGRVIDAQAPATY